MNILTEDKQNGAANLNPYTYSIIAAWTILLIIVFAWNCLQVKDKTIEEAKLALRLSVESDLNFRAWATSHGGVYIPLNSQYPPNPYLSHLDDYLITTTDGKNLSLHNPAYIMRQVQESRLDDKGIYGRLTSPNAINPLNLADTWEKGALERLRQDKSLNEIVEISSLNEQTTIRLIQPFYIEEGCLKCHSHQGSKLGDLYGGISAAMPLEPYKAIILGQQLGLSPGYLLIWLVGLIGIAGFMFKFNSLTNNLQEKEERNRAMIRAIPDILFHYDAGGLIINAELEKDFPLFQAINEDVLKNDLVNKNIDEILPEKLATELKLAIGQLISTREMQLLEYQYLYNNKIYYLESRLILMGEDEVISIVRDITKQKISEAKLEYLSYHDKLTHLYNRNYFENEMRRLSNSRDYPISIIMADVNGLKLVNDALGHAKGDKLLVESARILKTSLRGSDILARVGGDEFVVLLPKTNAEEGLEIVKRIKDNISQHNENLVSLPISLSLGIATADNNEQSLMNTFKEADDFMYKEKGEKGHTAKQNMMKLLLATLSKADYDKGTYNRILEVCHNSDIKVTIP